MTKSTSTRVVTVMVCVRWTVATDDDVLLSAMLGSTLRHCGRRRGPDWTGALTGLAGDPLAAPDGAAGCWAASGIVAATHNTASSIPATRFVTLSQLFIQVSGESGTYANHGNLRGPGPGDHPPAE